MKSTFLPTGLGYVYRIGDTYDPDLLTIEATNIRQRNGSPYALLTTSTTIRNARRIPDTNRVLNAEVWLLSASSRGGYAQQLERLIPAPTGAMALDFSALLEEMAQRVIEAENSPVNVVRLDPSAKHVQVPYLVEGIIPAGKPTILYGAGGVGKSIFAAALAMAVQTGRPFLGQQSEQAEVLYLDWETDEADIGARVASAGRGLGIHANEMPRLRYSALVQPLEMRVNQLARYVAEEQVGLVVIDSVGMAMSTARDGSDASETAIRFFRALRALNTAVLAIDHVAGEDMRRGKAGASKPYGSVYKWNSARNAFELRQRKDADQKGIHLLLKHRKSNLGPQMWDVPLVLDWSQQVATFSRERVRPVTVKPIEDQIADVLDVGPATPSKIADMLSDDDVQIGEMDVRRALKGMIGAGQVTAMLDGSIRMKPIENPDPPLLPEDE